MAQRASRRRALTWVVGVIVMLAAGALLTIRALQFHPPQDGRIWDMRPPAPVADNMLSSPPGVTR